VGHNLLSSPHKNCVNFTAGTRKMKYKFWENIQLGNIKSGNIQDCSYGHLISTVQRVQKSWKTKCGYIKWVFH
jgi:hypothetical protein